MNYDNTTQFNALESERTKFTTRENQKYIVFFDDTQFSMKNLRPRARMMLFYDRAESQDFSIKSPTYRALYQEYNLHRIERERRSF